VIGFKTGFTAAAGYISLFEWPAAAGTARRVVPLLIGKKLGMSDLWGR
jgi:hypothetical protein